MTSVAPTAGAEGGNGYKSSFPCDRALAAQIGATICARQVIAFCWGSWPTVMDINVAVRFATEVHRDQKDKAGAPYILHLFRVMNRLSSEQERIVALLHDCMEDHGISRAALLNEGFSDEVVSAVEALTRGEGEPYQDFVRRAAANPLARRVKIADLEDNMDIRRLSEITDRDVQRLRKYLEQWRFLTTADRPS